MLSLCMDCTLALDGADAHELGRVLPIAVTEFVHSVKPGEITRLHGHTDFSWSPCDGCQSALGGERFEHEDHR